MGGVLFWLILLVMEYYGHGPDSFGFKAVLYIGIGIVVIACIGVRSTDRKAWRAYVNWTDHWSRGGWDMVDEQRRWENEAKRKREAQREEAQQFIDVNRQIAEREHERELKELKELKYRSECPAVLFTRKADSEVRTREVPEYIAPTQRKSVCVCHTCGRPTEIVSRRALWDGRVAKEYWCPYCRKSDISYI